MVASNYASLNPPDPQSLQELVNGEDYKSRSDKSLHYTNKATGPDTLTHGYVNQDQEFSSGLQRPGQLVGAMGSKYTRRHMNDTHRENIEDESVNDTGHLH